MKTGDVALMLAVAVVACAGPAKEPKTAAKAQDVGGIEKDRQLAAGSSVCVAQVIGLRQPIEDALREQNLEPTAQCTYADVILEETGEPGKFVLRYQLAGEGDWMTCKSAAQTRLEFVTECTARLVEDVNVTAADETEPDADADADE
jgi:hypothetical protein